MSASPLPDLDAALVGRARRLHLHDAHPPSGGSVRVSDVPGCLRRLTLHYAGMPPTNGPSDEDAVLFEEGLNHETQVLYGLQREGHLLGRQQTSVKGRFSKVAAYGKIDGWLYDHSAVIEVKSVPGELPDKPGSRAVGQALIYVHFSYAKRAALIYKSRTTGQTRTWWLDPSPRLMREYAEKIQTVRQNVERGVLPAALHPDVCHRCPYRSLCHPQEYPRE